MLGRGRFGAVVPMRFRWLYGYSLRPLRNLLVRQPLAPVADLHSPVFPFAHHDLAPRRRVAALPRDLVEAVFVTHYPVVSQRALRLDAKDFIQLPLARPRSVIVLRLRRRSREPPVVFRQVLLFQIPVRRLVRPDLLPPHLLDQPVLVRPVIALHSPFGLRRTGCESASANARTSPQTALAALPH